MVHPAQTRIMQNGTGWYWEVVTYDKQVVARGVADTHAQSRADAEKAASRSQQDPPDDYGVMSQVTASRYIRSMEAGKLRLASRLND